MKNNFCNEIVYQVMPDRFNMGTDSNLEKKIEEGLYSDRVIPKKWDQLPEDSENRNFQFFGGDLNGITEKVDYLEKLGITALYLTPIFEADTYHKYDATNFKKIDKAFGGDSAFDSLLEKLHQKNIKLIMDIALNHVSVNHPYFQDAIANPDSKYRNFFSFIEYPEKYQCWWDRKYLPELNLNNPEVIEEFITGPESVIKFWLNRGVDGIRLDCANDLGVKINKIIYDTVKKVKPEATLIGEVFHFAPAFTEGLDSLQSYFYTESIFSLLNNEISSRQFGINIQNTIDRFPHEKLINSFVILSSHDSRRVLTALDNNMKKLFIALLLQFTLPGVPKIYYGDEIGMSGADDPFNRAPMIWDENSWNRDIADFYKSLIKLRKERIEFREGKLIEISNWLDNGVIAFVRYYSQSPEKCSIVIINPTGEKKKFKMFIPYDYLISDMQVSDYFTGEKDMVAVSYMNIEIDPMDYKIYSPDPEFRKEYNYYKRVSPMN